MTDKIKEISPQEETVIQKPLGPIGAGLSLALTVATLAFAASEPGHLDQGTESLPPHPDNLETKSEET